MTLMRCFRSSTLVYINSPVVKLASLHAASLKVQNQSMLRGDLGSCILDRDRELVGSKNTGVNWKKLLRAPN